MKKIIIILLISVVGCNKDKENVVQTKGDEPLSQKEEATDRANFKMIFANEKIALIAIKNKIPSDSVYLILNNYYNKTGHSFVSEIEVYEKIIDSISKDLKIPKEKVASLIFDFEQGKRDYTDE